MEHLAEFLKLIFEKGTWLAAVAAAALALAVGRHYGYLADVDGGTVFFVYLAGAICGGVLLIGGAVTGARHLGRNFKDRVARRKLRQTAVRNLSTLPAHYQMVLVWLFAKDIQRVSEEGETSTLDTLAAQGYLEREDDREAFNVIRTYRVTDEIWTELGTLDISKIRKQLPEKPPWRHDWRI